MSKRVSNSRSNRTPGKMRARQRVRYGWRVQHFAREGRRLGIETEGVTT
jgi:hypothetical protein